MTVDTIETADERDARTCGFDVGAWTRLPQHVRRSVLRLARQRDDALAQAATALGASDTPAMAVLDPHVQAVPLPTRGDRVLVRFLLSGDDASDESHGEQIDVTLSTDRDGRRTLAVHGSAGTRQELAVLPRSGNAVELAFTESTW